MEGRTTRGRTLRWLLYISPAGIMILIVQIVGVLSRFLAHRIMSELQRELVLMVAFFAMLAVGGGLWTLAMRHWDTRFARNESPKRFPGKEG